MKCEEHSRDDDGLCAQCVSDAATPEERARAAFERAPTPGVGGLCRCARASRLGRGAGRHY
jgi:hypothetical protein